MQTYEDFAKIHGLTLDVTRKPSRSDSDGWDKNARHFACRLAKDEEEYFFSFSQGSAHTKEPTIADVLCSLALDASGTDEEFEDWARNLGFDPDSRKAEKIYNACVDCREQLESLLGHDVLNELLYETNEDGED